MTSHGGDFIASQFKAVDLRHTFVAILSQICFFRDFRVFGINVRLNTPVAIAVANLLLGAPIQSNILRDVVVTYV